MYFAGVVPHPPYIIYHIAYRALGGGGGEAKEKLLAKLKNEWSYTSTPAYFFVSWCIFKHREFCALKFCLWVYMSFYYNKFEQQYTPACFHISIELYNPEKQTWNRRY
jgi:hypothetical protein